MYARNSVNYGNQPFALVNGSEFITGSSAQQWWAISTNNPVDIPASGVYSNLTPDENLRVTEEAKIGGKTAYLGINDFNPNSVDFPLNVNGLRLGDVLKIDVSQLVGLPGGEHLHFAVSDHQVKVDVEGTKLGSITGNKLTWDDIKYNPTAEDGTVTLDANSTTGLPSVGQTFTSLSDVITLYDGYEGKFVPVDVNGNGDVTEVGDGITITITEDAVSGGPGATLVIPVIPSLPGHGMIMKLTTTKVGWYDSATIGLSDQNIKVDINPIVLN